MGVVSEARSGLAGAGAETVAVERATRAARGSRWLVALGVIVLAAGVALRFLTRSALWSDEALSVNIARLPLADLRHLLRADGHPPLFYLLLHVWIRVFGSGDFTVRALSGVISVATLPAAWYAGRRLDERRARLGTGEPGERTVASAALLLLASSAFAIRYATEARMYALMILLGFVGYLALARALERPSTGRLFAVAVVVGFALYTHYWAFGLIATVGAWLLWASLRGEDPRAARLTLVAVAVGCLAFVPWFPTFLYQLRHTGTPWSATVSPWRGGSAVLHEFGGAMRIVAWGLMGLAGLAVFARASGRRHLDVKLDAWPGVRTEAVVGGSALLVGLLLSWVDHAAVEGRYAAFLFGVYVLVIAFGLSALASHFLRYSVLAACIGVSFVGGVRAVNQDRTQARESANIVAKEARPGDVVAYCPDTIAPDVARLLPAGLQETTFPPGPGPNRIDWRDRTARVGGDATAMFAAHVLDLAGRNHDVWFAWEHAGREMRHKCETIMTLLTQARPSRVDLVEPNSDFFEHQGLIRFRAQ